MEERIAVLSIIVENGSAAPAMNMLLHEYRSFIKGRMGLPEVKQGISVISIVLCAPTDKINDITGKIGMIKGIKAKTLIR